MSTRAQILIIEEKEDESKKLNLDKIAKIIQMVIQLI